jgi:hypothetical protein
VLEIREQFKRTCGRSTEIPINGTWNIDLLQSVGETRSQDYFLARKVNPKNPNGRFHMVAPVLAKTQAKHLDADEIRLAAKDCNLSVRITECPS